MGRGSKGIYEAIEENPNDPVAYINFGNVLTAVGDDEKGIEIFSKSN